MIRKGKKMKKESIYCVSGKIINEQSKFPIQGLIVEAYDKDLMFDDRLGSSITNEKGDFEIKYNEEDFQEFIFDKKPDLYLRIKNHKGKVIFSTENSIRYNAGKKEAFIINIPPEKLGLSANSYSVIDSNTGKICNSFVS